MAEETENLSHKIAVPRGAVTSSETQIRRPAEGFKQIYANNVQIGFSSFDMGLTFGLVAGEQDDKTVIDETVRIIMPRELAKLFGVLLMQNIISYERQFGEIKIPTPLLADEEEASDDEEPPEEAMTRAVTKARRDRKK